MANRSGRAPADIRPFRPAINTAEGLPEVSRATGTDSEALFSVGKDLSEVFGKRADEQAKIEGDRAGQIAGNDPTYRPSGDQTTIRGHAFTKAATSTYLDTLDAQMREKAMTVYRENKDNPVALAASFQKLQADILENDAFPEIQGQVKASFQRLALPFQMRSLDAADERVKDQSRAAALTANVGNDATVVAAVESRPYDPQTRKIVREQLDEANRRDERLVQDQALSAEDAAKRKLARERNASVREAGAAISNIKDVEELTRHEEIYKAKKAKGELGAIGADPLAMDQVEAAFAQRRTQILTEGKRLTGSVQRTAEDILTRMQSGYVPPPEEVARLRAVASQAPEGTAAVERLDRRMSWTRVGLAKGPQEIERLAREMRTAAGGQTLPKELAEDISYLDGLAQKIRTETVSDPIGFQRRQGNIKVDNLNLDDPKALAAGIRERAAVASAMAPEVNKNGRMLEPGEVKDLLAKVNQGGEGAVLTIEALVAGAGKDAPKLMRELGGSAPELAQAGLLLHGGGSKQAARDIIGAVVARELPGGAKPMEPHNGLFRKVWVEKTADAFLYNTDDSLRIEAAAKAIAMTRLRGADNAQDSTAKNIYSQAIDEAVGGQKIDGITYGGMAKVRPGYWHDYKVPVPPEIKSDQFVNVLAMLRQTDLANLPIPIGAGYSVNQVREAVPVAVRGGYRFSMNGPSADDPRFIKGADGKDFVLPWDKVRGILRERMPGAFIGGGR